MKIRNLAGLAVIALFVLRADATVAPRHVDLKATDKNTREIFQESLAMGAAFYDPSMKLLKAPAASAHDVDLQSGYHMVRESSWYALGLLVRDESGDRQRAAQILDAVLNQQFMTPGKPWYGTFRRAPEEPDPAANAAMWRNFDPNWRVFIGTTFEIILIEYPDRISPELAGRMYAAIDRAIDGEIAEKRLLPSYSNIALMYGALWDFAAVHDNRVDWKQQSAAWTESVYNLYRQYGSFFEYNSPTYSGVDLYGLALWRSYGSTPRIQAVGAEMEAGLWRNLAALYQPQLRNLAGPYDRSYGMDMESYVSVVGLWMRNVMDRDKAPFPPLTQTTDHLADVWLAPQMAVLGAHIPPDAFKKMTAFAGPHLAKTQIADKRVATSWVGDRVIFGGEATSKTKDAGQDSQFHPATIQWRTPSGKIGWVQLLDTPAIDAIADPKGLSVSTSGTVHVRIHAKGIAREKVVSTAWQLPGLRVAVRADQKGFSASGSGDNIELVYEGITSMRWNIEAAAN